jgi:hypothetical protein
MIDRDKISKDIGILKNKYGSFRAAAKATRINKASLENYFDKITEPREKNILKLASAAHRDPDYYYTGQTPQITEINKGGDELMVPKHLFDELQEKYIALRVEIELLKSGSVDRAGGGQTQ